MKIRIDHDVKYSNGKKVDDKLWIIKDYGFRTDMLSIDIKELPDIIKKLQQKLEECKND